MTSKEYFPPDPDLITTSRLSIELTVMASTIAGYAISVFGIKPSEIEVAVAYKLQSLYPSIPEDELAIYAKEGTGSAMRFMQYLGVFIEGGLQ